MTAPLPDGTEISKHAFYMNFNHTEQTMVTIVRYRRMRGETILEEQLVIARNVGMAKMRWF